VTPGLVSTVIPVRNRAALLREAVGSVLAQTHRPIEIVIVDDGSDDDTPAAIASLVREHPAEVRALRLERRGGPGLAREAGRRALCGEFVQWLDSDDLLPPRKFEWQVDALRRRPECDVAYGRAEDVFAEDGPPVPQVGRVRADEAFPAMLAARLWDTFAPLYRRRVVDEAGAWLPLRSEEDWEYDCRIASRGGRLAFVDETVGYHRHFAPRRTSRGGGTDPRKLRDRARARLAILGHARRAGVDPSCPEMRAFERGLFLLCRQCAAAGQAEASRRLFEGARSIARAPDGPDYRWFDRFARRLGWRTAGVVSREIDRVRDLVGASR
jgi:glycosyltransferase involved in cell wall biosynthesis